MTISNQKMKRWICATVEYKPLAPPSGGLNQLVTPITNCSTAANWRMLRSGGGTRSACVPTAAATSRFGLLLRLAHQPCVVWLPHGVGDRAIPIIC
jgi:hypothetical protein